MSIILNIFYSFIYLSFLFFSIWGYGSLLKKQFKKKSQPMVCKYRLWLSRKIRNN